MKLALSPDNRSDLAQQCVKCGLCLPHCPTYALTQYEAESPRGRIALMSTLAETPEILGDSAQLSLDNCLACRRCESVCPAHVSYDALLIGTRAARKPLLPWRAKIALWLMAHKPWLNGLLSLYRIAYKLLPPRLKILPKPVHNPSTTAITSRSAVFSGCIANTYEHGVRIALLKLLQTLGESAETPSQQVCCGQAALHVGDHATARQLATKNHSVFTDYDRLLVLASGCFSALEHITDIPVLDACEYLQQCRGRLPFKSAQGLRVALHIPCTASFHQQQHAVLALLKQIPDLHIISLNNQGCCGAAGLHQITHPLRAAQFRSAIIEMAEASGVTVLLSQNIGCRLHLANAVTLQVLHPIELMAQYINATPSSIHS
jgi:glycolate oxidase iron-sulfur subunit